MRRQTRTKPHGRLRELSACKFRALGAKLDWQGEDQQVPRLAHRLWLSPACQNTGIELVGWPLLLSSLLFSMEHRKKVLSEGEHPIYLHEIDDSSVKLITPIEAEIQDLSEPRDESVLSSTSDERLPHPQPGVGEIGSSDRELSATLRLKEINSTAARRQNHNLGDDLVSSEQTSSNAVRDQSDEVTESSEQSSEECDSDLSYGGDESDLDGDVQIGLVGQQFQDGDDTIPDLMQDSVLNASVSRHIIRHS